MNIPSHLPSKSGMPWSPAAHAENSGEKDSWVTTYMDIVTLMLTLFVILVAYQMHAKSAPETEQTEQAAQQTTAQTPSVVTAGAPTTDISAPNARETADTTGTETLTQLQVAAATVAEEQSVASPTPTALDAESVDTAATVERPLDNSVEHIADAATQSQPNQQLVDGNLSAQSSINPAVDVSKLQTALKAALGENSPSVEIHPNGFAVALDERILFDRGSAALSDSGQDVLRSMAPALAQFDGEIFVEGHTDNLPISTAVFPSNWELSTHRATSVTRLLIESGLAPSRLRAVGFGDTHPIADNGSPEGRAANRRVSLVVNLPTPAVQY